MSERIQHVRKLYVDEITTTLALDDELSREMAECKTVNSEHTRAADILTAKKAEHSAAAQLRDKVQKERRNVRHVLLKLQALIVFCRYFSSKTCVA